VSKRRQPDIMLDAARREAESVLLDRRYFTLPGEAFKRFTSVLDNRVKDNPRFSPPASDQSALGSMSNTSKTP